jgi:hypothetical protein
MTSIAIISVLGILTQPVQDSIIGCHFFKGQSGIIYVADWWTNPDLSRLPDSDTVQNVTAGTFTKEQAVEILTSGKALVIHGLPDMQTALDDFGLVRCDKDGNIFSEVHE